MKVLGSDTDVWIGSIYTVVPEIEETETLNPIPFGGPDIRCFPFLLKILLIFSTNIYSDTIFILKLSSCCNIAVVLV